MRGLCLGALLCFAIVIPCRAAGEPPERKLTDYANDDGRVPDGKDPKADDTSALHKALAVGPGIVRIGPGMYRFGDVTIPSEVTLTGAGTGTVIRSSGSKQIFVQKAVHGWAIRDLLLDGEATGDWRNREDAGQSGIFTEQSSGFDIAGVTLKNFNGAGLQLTYFNRGKSAFSHAGNLDRVIATGNYVGIRFDVRAEYIIGTRLNCYENRIGCIIHAGNTNISASNFGTNVDGLLIQDKENGSHGSISNCLLNHNERFALRAYAVGNGMAINNCCFFYGTIELEDSVGVNITSGLISCAVTSKGKGINRLSGNYIIPESFGFHFTPETIVTENFTKRGIWDKNQPGAPPPKTE